MLLEDSLEFGDLLGGDVLRGPGSQFTGQLRLSPEEVTHVLLRERGHDEASTGDQFDEAFAPECKEPLADGRRANSHRFGNPFDAEEIACTHVAGNDHLAYVRGNFLRELLSP
nr:hypothetical protein GCM10017611_47380 [Rhodococcus wratislaviensis]